MLVGVALSAHLAKAQSPVGKGPPVVATSAAQSGLVEQQFETQAARPLVFGDELTAGARVRASRLGFARLDFAAGGGIRLFESSEVALLPRPLADGEHESIDTARRVMVSVERGTGLVFFSHQLLIQSADRSQLLLVARGDSAVQVRLTRTEKGLEVAAIQGTVTIQVSGTEHTLTPGQFTEVIGGEAGESRPLVSPPHLEAPDRDARFHCDGLLVRLAWRAEAGAKKYRLQVARDPGFQQLLKSEELEALRYVFVPAEAGRYAFRVAAGAVDGRWSDFSEPRAIACEKTPPEDYLLSPEPNAVARVSAKTGPLKFTWAAAPGTPTYRFILARSSELQETTVLRQSTTEAQIEIAELPSGDYFWGVYIEDPLPYPLFLSPRALLIKGSGSEFKTPKLIKDWGK